MGKRVAIIGSFRKYYEQVVELIDLFNATGIYVTSPKKSTICSKIDDFVIFESDNEKHTPEEIQMITLDKILAADCIYVYNPEGYLGRTTCYEIGFCFSRSKPIYFSNRPIDLPIPVNQEQIVSPVEFSKIILSEGIDFLLDYKMCEEANNSFRRIFNEETTSVFRSSKNVVICGSMKFFPQMVACKNQLELEGINCIVPKDEAHLVNLLTEKQLIDFKRKVSTAYLKKIRDKNTVAVLIYNQEKNGVSNYIGANTLVELAMAFMWNRKIFLLNEIYEPLKDELIAWKSICLKGNLTRLISDINKEQVDSGTIDLYSQLSLDDYFNGEDL